MTEANPLSASRIWVLVDGISGHDSQSLGVAEALEADFETKPIALTGVAAVAAGLRSATLLRWAGRAALPSAPPWPDVVIATGSRLGAVARAIKRQCGGKSFLAQIMSPGAGAADFDLIAAPRHDRQGTAPNRIETTGAPHRVTAARLADAAGQWRGRFEHLPRPWIAVLVGGATRRRAFDARLAAELGHKASALARGRGGSLLVSTSRRTMDGAAAAFEAAIDAPCYVHRWQADEGDGNPYFGILGLGDGVVVTGDSMSMCSEACATGKPVYIFAPPAITKPAYGRLHRELYDLGQARPLAETFEDWSYPPLDTAAEIAAVIRQRFARYR
ncbi:MAG: mitochondrial fission ELM1 family protein [Alphaproteobacteria bacterium]